MADKRLKRPKRPRDMNELAKSVVDLATMDEKDRQALKEKLERDQTPGKRGSVSPPAKGKA
jgi:hypothetical protein